LKVESYYGHTRAQENFVENAYKKCGTEFMIVMNACLPEAIGESMCLDKF